MNKIRKKILSTSLALLLLVIASGCNKKNSNNVTSNTLAEKQSTTEDLTTTKELKEVTEVVITAAGDCTLGSDKNYSYNNSFEEYYDKYGPEYFFDNVKQVFLNDDFTVLNLECALTDSTRYANKQYVYKGKKEYAKILSKSDVELVSLSNNHTYDYLEKGFNDTIDSLNKENIGYAYKDKIQIMQKGNIKVAFISVCSWDCSKEQLEEYFNKADKEGADLKILCVHWGVNYQRNYNSSQENFGHMAVDLGADLILGHHPHILQGIEIYKDVPIVYSLGNFCYAGKKLLGNEISTMIFQITFNFINNKLNNKSYKIIPTYMSSQNPKNTYQPTIITNKEEKDKVLKLVYSLSKNI
ncbi:MAG TPA: CapA family protein [Bacilli bacterium]|nr:CapA family protein [Bacilli bacterium]